MSRLIMHVQASHYGNDEEEVKELAHDISSLAQNLDVWVTFSFYGEIFSVPPTTSINEIIESVKERCKL